MALNATKSKRLEDAGLDEYFDQHRPLWHQKAKRAYDYAREFVVDTYFAELIVDRVWLKLTSQEGGE